MLIEVNFGVELRVKKTIFCGFAGRLAYAALSINWSLGKDKDSAILIKVNDI